MTPQSLLRADNWSKGLYGCCAELHAPRRILEHPTQCVEPSADRQIDL